MIKYVHKKSFGQNFLKDPTILKLIALKVAELGPKKTIKIYEIGVGLGALTRYLLDIDSSHVSGIERDRDLIPRLKSLFYQELASGRFELIEADAVQFIRHIPSESVLCGNLPYNLSSSILFETAELYRQIYGSVYLLQKEVAERIVSKPNSRVYGLLSVLMQSRYEVSILAHVPRHVFEPIPKVDSAVICFKTKSQVSSLDWKAFVKLVKIAFSQRRKTLSNSLSSYANINLILNSLQINPQSRAENLSFEDYERILSCL